MAILINVYKFFKWLSLSKNLYTLINKVHTEKIKLYHHKFPKRGEKITLIGKKGANNNNVPKSYLSSDKKNPITVIITDVQI